MRKNQIGRCKTPRAKPQNLTKILLYTRVQYNSLPAPCAHQFIRVPIPSSLLVASPLRFACYYSYYIILASRRAGSAVRVLHHVSFLPDSAAPQQTRGATTGHGSPIRSGDVRDRRLPGQGRRRVVRGLDCFLVSPNPCPSHRSLLFSAFSVMTGGGPPYRLLGCSCSCCYDCCSSILDFLCCSS